MGKLCDRCSLVILVWDDHPTCVKCRLAAGICTLDIHNPCLICQSWSMITWGKLRQSLRDARQKSVKRGTLHCSCKVPTLLTWVDSASSSLDFISETGSISDSDLRDVDLELAAVTAPAQVIEASVPSGSVGVLPTIDAGHAPTLDNVIPVLLCATLITCSLQGLLSCQECKDQSAFFQVCLKLSQLRRELQWGHQRYPAWPMYTSSDMPRLPT